jgi:hypothetical protein
MQLAAMQINIEDGHAVDFVGNDTEDTEDFRHKLLWAAVIRRAMNDWAQYRGARELKKKNLYVNAHRFLFEQRNTDEFRSFEWCCTALDIDPDKIREVTRELTRAEVKSSRTKPGC